MSEKRVIGDPSGERIQYYGDDLDEVCVSDIAHFHLEYMDDKTVWMRCDKRDGSAVVVVLSSRCKIRGNAETEQESTP